MSVPVPARTSAIVSKDPLEVLADIVQTEMELEDGRVMIGFEKFDIGPLPGLYVALQYLSSKPIGAASLFDGEADEEVQRVAMTDVVQIDVISYNDEATKRRVEVLMALRSHYAQRQMELHSVKIGRLPQFFGNASFADGPAGSYQHRYVARFFVNSIYSKRKATDTYAVFAGKLRLDDAAAVDFDSRRT